MKNLCFFCLALLWVACQPARSDIYEEIVNTELVKKLIANADSTYEIESDSIDRVANPLWIKGLKLVSQSIDDYSILWYDEQGQLTGLMEYSAGLLKDSILFHPNGQRMFSILIDKNGLPSGPARYYYPDGRVSADGKFEKGLKTGIWREYKPDGKLDLSREYDKYGNPKR